MSSFRDAVMTDAGAKLQAMSIAEGFTIEFVKMEIGNGIYTKEEKTKEALQSREQLKEVKQEFGFSSISATKEKAVLLKAIITNQNLIQGYRMTEIGIIAKKQGDTDGVLYSIAIAEEADYLPDKDSPAEYIQEYYTKVSNSENVTINVEMGAYALAEDLNKVTYPVYEENEELEELQSGESVFTAFGKIKKAVKKLIDHMENRNNPHEVTKVQLGINNVPNVTTNNQTPTFTPASVRVNIVSGDTLSILFGKIMKWLGDLKTAAFATVANNETTTEEGYVADARIIELHKRRIENLNNSINASNNNLNTHKASSDHDGRYYTETEVNNLMTGKAAASHTHDDRYYTEAEVNSKIRNVFPKYSGMYKIASTTQQQIAIPTYGYLEVCAYYGSSRNANCQLWIGGNRIFITDSTQNISLLGGMYLVSPTDIVDFYVNSGDCQLWFIPCVLVN